MLRFKPFCCLIPAKSLSKRAAFVFQKSPNRNAKAALLHCDLASLGIETLWVCFSVDFKLKHDTNLSSIRKAVFLLTVFTASSFAKSRFCPRFRLIFIKKYL